MAHGLRRGTAAGLVLGLLGLLIVAGTPGDAEACAPPRCVGGWFLPPDGLDETAVFPANIGAILWVPKVPWGFPSVTDGSFSLTDLGDSSVVPITIVQETANLFLVKPVDPLDPEKTYRAVGGDFCNGTGLADETAEAREFRTAAVAALPTELGTLSAATPTMGELSVSTPSGSCADMITAVQVSISLELAPAALPWKDAFVYRTLVDGQHWAPQHSVKEQLPPGASWVGRGTDLLFHRCAAVDPMTDSGLSAGRHSVRIVAELPGHEVSVSTPEIEVELECFEPADAGLPDAGGIDEDAGSLDAEIADAGAEPLDAGLDAPADASTESPAPETAELDSGCGCTSPGAAGGLWWLGPGLIALLRRRNGRGRPLTHQANARR